MDLPTDERLARLEKQMDRVDTRLKAVERALKEIKTLNRPRRIGRDRNYDAP